MVRTDIRNLAITALQAMNQPECEICRLFEKKYTLTDKDGDCYMIRFCPNCGRELKGGE